MGSNIHVILSTLTSKLEECLRNNQFYISGLFQGLCVLHKWTWIKCPLTAWSQSVDCNQLRIGFSLSDVCQAFTTAVFSSLPLVLSSPGEMYTWLNSDWVTDRDIAKYSMSLATYLLSQYVCEMNECEAASFCWFKASECISCFCLLSCLVAQRSVTLPPCFGFTNGVVSLNE